VPAGGAVSKTFKTGGMLTLKETVENQGPRVQSERGEINHLSNSRREPEKFIINGRPIGKGCNILKQG